MKACVVSAHFNEDLTWITLSKYPVVVYSKTINLSYNYIPFNKVQEVPAYLKYIIDHYECLPEYTFFVHGHRQAYHQDAPIDVIINRTILSGQIINLNRPDWYVEITPATNKPDSNWAWVDENWTNIFGSTLKKPDLLSFWPCAQFAVHCSCIQQYPKRFWEYIYAWCIETDLDNWLSSRIMEYCWYYIFTQNEHANSSIL